mgnify:CR=1 FL=1
MHKLNWNLSSAHTYVGEEWEQSHMLPGLTDVYSINVTVQTQSFTSLFGYCPVIRRNNASPGYWQPWQDFFFVVYLCNAFVTKRTYKDFWRNPTNYDVTMKRITNVNCEVYWIMDCKDKLNLMVICSEKSCKQNILWQDISTWWRKLWYK